jgi:hypothetical protein
MPLLFIILGIVVGLGVLLALTGRGNYRAGVCQVCRREAQLNEVSFSYNIGMLVARRYATIKGLLCKSCIHRTYWKFAAINLTVGWLGYISLIVAPIFLLANTWIYLRSMGMTPPALAPANTGFNPSPPPVG